MGSHKSANARSLDRAAVASRHRYLLRRMRRSVRLPNPRAVVVSRMLVFQSKLLLLHGAERAYQASHQPDDLKRVERIRSGLHRAEGELRRTAAGGRTARASAYWLSVYTSLIEKATTSLSKLKDICAALPVSERFEIATDVQMLEEVITQWIDVRRNIERTIALRART